MNYDAYEECGAYDLMKRIACQLMQAFEKQEHSQQQIENYTTANGQRTTSSKRIRDTLSATYRLYQNNGDNLGKALVFYWTMSYIERGLKRSGFPSTPPAPSKMNEPPYLPPNTAARLFSASGYVNRHPGLLLRQLGQALA